MTMPEYTIRKATDKDLPQMVQLFQHTVSHVNCRDYSVEQINAWCGKADAERWKFLYESELIFVVAEKENKEMVGFASINPSGYVHSMFVHKDYQGKGIATHLLDKLEKIIDLSNVEELFADVSITACPFFQARGFVIVKEKSVEVEGVLLKNFLMRKRVNK